MNFVKNYNRNWNLNRNFLIKKIKPKFIVGILAGLIISLILSFIENELLKNISFISFGILSLIFVIYSGLKRKWLNLIIGLFAFVSFFSKLNHYPYANVLKLLIAIPIVCFILTLRKKEKHENELSILIILFTYELTEFIKLT
ncbi:hypothetical protein C7H62_0550 [Mesoflavibacter sp. HG96]|nr:hypothetical protein C7H62_0550 [Mesoflavibacter sp. HG96]QIJ91087.1 hypothetical protein C7H56_0550 [Mesoflavibacter sp. HG37]